MTSESETLEELERSQAQIESFARRAHHVQCEIVKLEQDFLALDDFPGGLDSAVEQLSVTSRAIGNLATDAAVTRVSIQPFDVH